MKAKINKNLFKVKDGYVVVSNDSKLNEGDHILNVRDVFKRIKRVDKQHIYDTAYWQKIVATIGIQLDGVPYADVSDYELYEGERAGCKYFGIDFEEYQKILEKMVSNPGFNDEYSPEAETAFSILTFDDGYNTHKYKNADKKYTKADLEWIVDMCRKDRALYYNDDIATSDVVNSLLETIQEINSVEFETEVDGSLVQIEGIKDGYWKCFIKKLN